MSKAADNASWPVLRRYDGRERSPFHEAECGHQLSRAMASWAAVLALTGFHYCAVERKMTFAPREGTFFWVNGYAWGTCSLSQMDTDYRVDPSVLHGECALSHFVIREYGEHRFDEPTRLRAGQKGHCPRAARLNTNPAAG